MNGNPIDSTVPNSPVTITTPQSALLQLALFSLQELLRHAPEMFAQIYELFSKPIVTLEDIAALREQIAATRYKDIVKATAIPKEDQT